MKIIGAGVSGLLAGCMFPGSTIYEKLSGLPNNHGAILRFRSDKISKALGIPFKKVRVTKAIWLDGEEVQPSPRIQNMYSNKVVQSYTSRSISNIDPVDRWIAPDDFILQLAERCKIIFCREYPGDVPAGKPVISTIPMPVLLGSLMEGVYVLAKFDRTKIWNIVYEFDDIDLYQTIYFPGDIPIYRASFTGNKLICEGISAEHSFDVSYILHAFGINQQPYSEEVTGQEYGKIVDIDPDIRRSLIGELTHKHNIYSLGRYGTWRNILLDDVFDDIMKIRDLVKLDSYSRRLKL